MAPCASLALYCCLFPPNSKIPRDEDYAVFPLVTQGLVGRRPLVTFDEWMYEWSNAKYLGVNKSWASGMAFGQLCGLRVIILNLILLCSNPLPWLECYPPETYGSPEAQPAGGAPELHLQALFPCLRSGDPAHIQVDSSSFPLNAEPRLDFPPPALSESLDSPKPIISGVKWDEEEERGGSAFYF